MPVASIFSTVQEDLEKVEAKLQSIADVEYPVLSALLRHILNTGGKRLRPALALLSAKFHCYDLETLIPLASALELLHTATLVHDDIIDNATTRRGASTLNTIVDGRSTILIGDYLFARSAAFAAESDNLRVMKIFARTLTKICDGELRNMLGSDDLDHTRREYYRKIESKTAALFVAAVESGSVLSNAPENEIQALVSYGHSVGTAFQIVDDILDFVGDERKMGKPVGSDLRQGTVTLPAIYLLESRPNDVELRRLMRHHGDFPDREEGIKRLIETIANSSAIASARNEALDFVQQAKKALFVLPDNKYRRALADLADYVIERSS
ncbi:MAG: polyprenyl synthetase family protein [Chloroflexi bacterium]|nr:polyprenyl synthetase family protein [Chloroflexota bacterium]